MLDDGAEEITYRQVDRMFIDDEAALRIDADLTGAVEDVFIDDEIGVELVIEDLVFGVLDNGVEVLFAAYFFVLDLKIGIILVVLVDGACDFGGELFGAVGELDNAQGGLVGIAGDFGRNTVDQDHNTDEDGDRQQAEVESFVAIFHILNPDITRCIEQMFHDIDTLC